MAAFEDYGSGGKLSMSELRGIFAGSNEMLEDLLRKVQSDENSHISLVDLEAFLLRGD